MYDGRYETEPERVDRETIKNLVDAMKAEKGQADFADFNRDALCDALEMGLVKLVSAEGYNLKLTARGARFKS